MASLVDRFCANPHSGAISAAAHDGSTGARITADAYGTVAITKPNERWPSLVFDMDAGVMGAVLLSSLLESLLFGVPPRDALTLSAAALVLLVVTAIACVIPARRATRVDPAIALRLE